MRRLLLSTLGLLLVACQSAYYEAAEQVGYHKRDILVDRVEESSEAQKDAEEQFQSALEHFSAVVNFDGGELEWIIKLIVVVECRRRRVVIDLFQVEPVIGERFDESP